MILHLPEHDRCAVGEQPVGAHEVYALVWKGVFFRWNFATRIDQIDLRQNRAGGGEKIVERQDRDERLVIIRLLALEKQRLLLEILREELRDRDRRYQSFEWERFAVAESGGDLGRRNAARCGTPNYVRVIGRHRTTQQQCRVCG